MTNYPLSSNQQEIWFDQILHPNIPLYNFGGCLQINGPIDSAIFEQAVNQVVQENDALRIVLQKGEHLPTQVFLEHIDVKLGFRDFSNQNNPHQVANEWMQKECVKPFQLYDNPLFKFELLKITNDLYYSFHKYHHIIVDGWAVSLITQRISSAYNAILIGKHDYKHYSYLNFIKDEIEYLNSKKFIQHQRYWQEKYKQLPEPLIQHHSNQTFSSQRSTLCVKRSFYNQLHDFAIKNKVSTFHVILGTLYCYFVRVYERDDFIIGLPTLNRHNAAFKKTVGLFVSSSPAWFKFGRELNFIELIQFISLELKKDYRNQRFPLAAINRQFKQPLFDFTLSYAKYDYDINFNGNSAKASYFTNGYYPQKEALFILVEEIHQNEDVNIYFDYNLGVFNKDEIEQIKIRFEFLLQEVLHKPLVPIQDLQIMPDEELKKILIEFNDTKADYPQNKTIIDLFEEQVSKTPNNIAVVFEDQQLTYQELNNKSNQLAYHLQTLGVKPEVLVGICIKRSLEMIIGLLGILKAGGAYVPLDPTYPTERLNFMLEDAQVTVLLTQSNLAYKFSKPSIICIDEKYPKLNVTNPINELHPNNLAYVIYTSGSTGKPKGVQITHLSLLNFLISMYKQPGLSSNDILLSVTTMSFDIAALEIYLPLLIGAKIVLASDIEVNDGSKLLGKLNDITIMQATPATWRLLIAAGWENSPQLKVLCGGEAISRELATDLLTKTQILWNMYGPTETTIWSTITKILTVDSNIISIGSPISNTEIYILDKRLQPVPIGVSGELHIGGIGLARGYLNRPELTAEKFIKNPFSNEHNARIYKTGDLARYLPDGNIEYLGRIDNQVKIRGFRIELGEIETVLVKHLLIQEAVVISNETSQGLIAYLVPKKLDQVGEVNQEIIHEWRDIFDESYNQSVVNKTFNIVGWNSSYTGSLIPEEEMHEWVDATVNLIMSLQPNKVLEIGCGTGLLLSKIAPNCQKYWATDFSPTVLKQIEQFDLSNVKLFNREAKDFTDIESECFDTVVINSVIQYFPSVNYFLEVLEQAIKVVKPGGYIFIGDVRNLKLLKVFQTSVQLYKAADSTIASELPPIREEELLIDPDFFIALTQHFNMLQNVQIQLKHGRYVNGLTKFRYDVILQVGNEELPQIEIPWQEWQSLEIAKKNLLKTNILGFRNIPNSRLESDIKAWEWITNNPEATIGKLQQQQPTGIDPEELRKLAIELSYEVIISWASDCSYYNVLFKHSQNIQTFEPVQIKPWHQYVNNPLQDNLAEKLIPQLRQYLQKQLPDYMIPSAFKLLSSLPLTPNGKIDRKALAKIDAHHIPTEFIAPQTQEQELLADIWEKVLGIEQIGIHDNFFELGGHSLLATQVISRIRDTFKVELPLRDLFAAPTIEELSKCLHGKQTSLPAISKVDRSKLLQLSFAQQRLWILTQLEGASSTYNMPAALRLEGKLDKDILKQSLQFLVKRHESLRTIFKTINGEPTVQILDSEYQLPVISVETKIDLLINEEAQKPFNLETGPLFRTKLLKLAENSHILLINMHHIISDGWSIGILVREWNIIYKALVQNEEVPLSPLEIQYVDYANWQRKWLTDEILQEQLDYWQQKLANVPALLELPTDHKRLPVQSFKGSNLPISFSAELTLSLKQLSKQNDTTLFMTLWSAFSILLARYSGQNDIVIGSPIANRTNSQTESIIGFFVNTLVLRLDLNNNPSFTEVLRQAQTVALEAYSHQDIPFEQLVETLKPERNLNHTPLFQVMFVLQNVDIPDLKLENLAINFLELENTIAKFDLTLSLEETTSGLQGTLEYNTDLFKHTTIERMVGHFQTLLDGIVENPETLIHELPLLTIAEQQQFLLWNDTKIDYPQDKTIVNLFEEQVAKTPNNIAVVFEDQQLTYQELNEKSNQLAHHLQTLGIKPEVLVGICVERSLEMIIGLLGILKAGGAYVPLDPSYPTERLIFMLEDAQVPILLSQSNIELPKIQAQVVYLDKENFSQYSFENVISRVKPDNLVYVIYTSGSTGKPKGVMNTHKALYNHTKWMQYIFPLDYKDKVLQKTSISFDASIWEFYAPITAGATLIIAPNWHKDSNYLIKLIKIYGITIIQTVPSLLEIISSNKQTNKIKSLRRIFCGGEVLSTILIGKILNQLDVELINLYGPTESCIDTTFWECISKIKTVPIGQPISNTKIYILDKHLQPVPIGVSGELHIGGLGLARGYLNRPKLTAEKFIKNPFSTDPNSRIYKTGDLARYLPDGNIEYLGRIDNQVKIRGFRIELGEIETVLGQHTAVRENIIVVHETDSNNKLLIAYLVVQQVIENTELREFLKTRLPDYMIPATFVTLESLPLTPNGKIDRRALSQLSVEIKTLELIAPRTQEEELLANIWAEILDIEQVGIHDNFFELGGHSLLATQVISRIRDTFKVELPLRDLFASPTIAELSKCLHGQQTSLSEIAPVDRSKPLQLSFAQQRLWILSQLEGQSATYNMPAALKLEGKLDRTILEQSLQILIQRHESLRTVFKVIDDKPVVKILETDYQLPVITLTDSSQADLLINEEAKQPFNLETGPLFRTKLLKLAENSHILLINMHHIISDGWSIGILIREWNVIYKALVQNEEVPLSPLSIQYVDYANWQRQWLTDEVLQKQLDYWQQQLANIPNQLKLPTDKARPKTQTYNGDIQTHKLSQKLAQQLQNLSQKTGTTMFMTLLTGFATLLKYYSNQQDIVIGTPIANRHHGATESLIGFLVNILVLRINFSDNLTFQELLIQVREICLDAYANQDMPVEKLLDTLPIDRDFSIPPIVQATFSFQDKSLPLLEIQGLNIGLIELNTKTSKTDLTLFVRAKDDGLLSYIEYNTDLFKTDTISQILTDFERLLEAIADKPESNLTILLQSTDLMEIKQNYPLSSSQLAVWFDQILHPDRPLYNIGGYVKIAGKIDIDIFEQALNLTVQENDALRIIIHEGEPATQIFAKFNFKVKLHSFKTEQQAITWMRDEMAKVFSLYDEPLFKFALCKTDNCYYWFKKYHHLLVDGWGISLIVQRVAAIYNALVKAQQPQIEPHYYQDFIQNERDYLKSNRFLQAKRYWQEKYHELPESLITQKVPNQPSKRSTLCLKRSFYNQLIAFAEEHNVSTFHVILGVVYCYFIRVSNRDDFIVGLHSLNRSNVAFKHTVGMFMKLTPAWLKFGAEVKFIDLIQLIRKELQENYRHQRFPIGEINRHAKQEGKQLFDITISYAKLDYDTSFEGNPIKTIDLDNGFEQNPLAIFIEEFHQQDDVNIYFDYNLGYFNKSEINSLKLHLEFLLAEILRQPLAKVKNLPLISETEQQILIEFNNTATDYKDTTVVNLFEEQVNKTPNNIAVVFENQQLTYLELDQLSNQLAHHLQELDIKPNMLVGLCVKRSLEMIIGIFGILKSGGAYLPLDPDYPAERLSLMLENIDILLTQSNLLEYFPVKKTICLDTEQLFYPNTPVNYSSPENLIYAIYTSGSTGQPKGTGVYQHSFVNLLNWFITTFKFNSDDKTLLISSLSFDLTQKNIFAPLLVGGELHLAPQYSPSQIAQTINNKLITWINCTPSAFYPIIEINKLASLRWVFLGGEPILITRIKTWFDTTKLVNTYGPTECTDVCVAYQLENTKQLTAIPIGKPIFNTELFILDKYLNILPLGTTGELYIGGKGVGAGYLHDAEKTKQKFLPNPFKPNSRIYKTGDLARYLPDGNIEYLGRIDNQVKIRGFRIELGEIETVLRQHHNVQDAIVTADDSNRLIAYVVSYLSLDRIPYKTACQVEIESEVFKFQIEEISNSGLLLTDISISLKATSLIRLYLRLPGNSQPIWLTGKVAWYKNSQAGIQLQLNQTEQNIVSKSVTHLSKDKGFSSVLQRTIAGNLRNYLQDKLPNYMIPSAFVLLESIPLTPNGKIDRKALPKPDVNRGTDKVLPTTTEEKLLANIWSEVLGIEQVGIHDNFFELGGDSILSIQIVARANQAGMQLQAKNLFENQTIAKLAAISKLTIPLTIEQGLVTGTVPLIPIQHQFFEQNFPEPQHFNQSVLLEVPKEIKPKHLKQIIKELLIHHDSLRLRFTQINSGWQQANTGLEDSIPFTIIDLSAFSVEQNMLEPIANGLQASLNLTTGPLMQMALFKFGNKKRLLWIIHHLVVDGISWRILLEDLQIAYQQVIIGEKIKLPTKTTAFQTYAQQLVEYAQKNTFSAELEFWKGQFDLNALPVDIPVIKNNNIIATIDHVKVTLDDEQTKSLLQDVPQAYNTQINDVLLTALVQTFAQWTGNDSLVISLESHGREEVLDNIDVSRTVGWFTSIFPVKLIGGLTTPEIALKSVKEQLRTIPNHGMNYGVLRYLKQDNSSVNNSEVSFNYLGQFDSLTEYPVFKLTNEPSGLQHSPLCQRQHLLDINGLIIDSRLQLDWTYNKNIHNQVTIEQLAHNFIKSLEILIRHCQSTNGYTPSDFSEAGLNQAELDDIINEFGE